MRTTLTVDDKLHAEIAQFAREQHTSFKSAVNRVLLAGIEALKRPRRKPYRTPVFSMGSRVPDLDHALRLAAALDDDATVAGLDR